MSTATTTKRSRLPDRKTTACCTLCEERRLLSELVQGGGHNNYKCIDRKACERRVLVACGWEATEERIYSAGKYSRLATSCGACEEKGPINKHGLCAKCEANFVAANPGKER